MCIYHYANICFQLISSDTGISKGSHYCYALKLVKCIIIECKYLIFQSENMYILGIYFVLSRNYFDTLTMYLFRLPLKPLRCKKKIFLSEHASVVNIYHVVMTLLFGANMIFAISAV
jgi:hypothetical protein